ncbi:MAG: hypothetical protein PUG50_03615 [Eubacteriales bacterium]|uniref:hypothetical protein n=1 Tax=Fenollaria sp. TaxID=1965292 RepID=UPI002A75B358|nr:hypothetical protein [Fenollaria sp.]MDD7339657.1 hypothetical protein [Eubacteriales bacterium]MDY3106443.1 hypothetical protein [Fenollaria sp.]
MFFVLCLLLSSLLFISACSSNIASKFPIDEEGYPEQNYAMIDGEVYEIVKKEDIYGKEESDNPDEKTIDISTNKDEVEIVLPAANCCDEWVISPKNNVAEKTLVEFKVKGELKEGGPSTCLDVYKVKLNGEEPIEFKRVNVMNEEEYEAKKAYTVLKINVKKEN